MRARSIAINLRPTLGQVFQTLVRGLVEVIETLLPASVALDPDLDAPEDHLLATTEVNAQLDNISIANNIWLALDAGLTETDMIQESAGAAANVLDMPLAITTPELTMPPADDLALESHRSPRGRAGRRFVRIASGRVPLRVPAHTNDCVIRGQCPRDRWKDE